ncbi:SRC kinase signaling inhibitor 1 isoform X3 [Silurus meridionalis]|uniref:SRC kinase signaling inhibitor 1 isoform X3 n=1 Tax=Silurus meridionalis TaxID=175797 RepID=UPI001EEC0A3B|nr:SRC kinase signaling inhibitor 1 isoform X3 [Silurus meridionalis]
MIRGDHGEYQRQYHTLGNSARRFSNPDVEAMAKLHAGDTERQRGKYPPQHAATLVSANCSRQQQPHYWSFKARTPRASGGGHHSLADQGGGRSFYASAENLETMGDADLALGFSRSNRLRQSLPLARSPSQNKFRPPGVLFLQFGDETRRVHLSHELSSMETLHALIVHVFPQQLNMSALRSPATAILIKDEARNVFYELDDPRRIHDRCVLKIYCRDTPYNTQHHHAHHGHVANGDMRRELVYTSRDSSPTRRLNALPSSSSPSASPSRPHSRLSYASVRPSSYAGPTPSPQAQPYQHQHQNPNHPAFCPSPSAILERRDVRPDEEVPASPSKSVVLLKNEMAYADPYALVHGVASPQSIAFRRGSLRSLSPYSAAALHCEFDPALYRPGGPLYTEPYGSMGFRTLPPASPQKLEPYRGHSGRGSPGRQGFRKDGTVYVEGHKARVGGPLLDQMCVMGGAGGEGVALAGYETDTRSRERMEAMEKQIASLTGLVQSVLTRAPDSPDKAETGSDCSAPETARSRKGKEKATTPSAPLALMPPPPTGTSQPITMSRLQMQLRLSDLQRSTTELRKQLSQLRKIQMQNQDSVHTLLRQAEADLGLCLIEASRTQEDPLQRQRLLVEEERLRYLNEEELIIQQLHDLERSVEEMKMGAGLNHRLVTEQEVEQKSQELRRLGETLTKLKNQFPTLQSKMRVVLRVEVEAVKFLKEEPLRLDALLKRCRNVTDTLAMLRRQVSEGLWKTPEDFDSSLDVDFTKSCDLDILTSPSLTSLPDFTGTLTGTTILSGSLTTNSASLGSGASLSCALGTSLGSCLSGAAGLAGTTTLGNWLASTGVVDSSLPEQDVTSAGTPKSRGIEDLPSRRETDKGVSVEVRLAAERDWEEKRASLTQFSAQDINRLLEETQAELMKAIPDLDFAAKQITKPAVPPKPHLSSLPKPASPSSTPSCTPEHQPGKPPPKPAGKEGIQRRESDRTTVGELTVPRYRTEKPSKSPPPPPPRRSFPSSHRLTTNSSGEVVIVNKSINKPEKNENCESDAQVQSQTPPVKLRRPSTSDGPRPSSTPPVIAASGMREDENEEEKIIAELENAGTPPGSAKTPASSSSSRLKQLQQGGLEQKNRKQREQQGQQQK